MRTDTWHMKTVIVAFVIAVAAFSAVAVAAVLAAQDLGLATLVETLGK